LAITLGNISYLLQFITAVVAVIYYKKYKDTPLRYLVYYLWYAVFMELVAGLMWNEFAIYNVWWYNIGINIEILFYLFIFYQYMSNRIVKKMILYGGIVYELYFLINYLLFFESWNTYQVFPFTMGSVLLILVIFLFLLEMFQSDKILFVNKYLIFWISLGLLFYYVIPMPLQIGETFFKLKNYSRDTRFFMHSIQYLGNLLMYFSFIYGFIWSSMTYKSL